MNPVRRLIFDLVEKKLWPVAVVLVASAVAIPLLIGGGGSEPGAGAGDPSAALAPAVAAASPAVELVGPPAVRSRPGAVRDPFRRAKAAKDAKPSAPGSSATSSAKGSSAKGDGKPSVSSASGAKKSGPSSSKTTPAVSSPDPRVASAARSTYQTVVRTTRPGGDWERALHRLAVIGNAANPVAQYLGVGDDGEYAIFVLGPNATASGDDGACVVLDGCRVIGLRPGDKLGVDVALADGSSRHYDIEVVHVRRLRMAAEQATRWRKRVDPIGREVQEGLAQHAVTAAALKRLRYSATTGTVGLTNAP